MTTREFQELSESRIILLDGATGSCLRAAGMPVGASFEAWILEHPETLIELQRRYVDAGSDVIYAPTFMANRIGLSIHGLEDRLEAMNRRHLMYNRELAYITEKQQSGDCLVICPDDTLPISRTSQNPQKMQKVYDMGRKAGEDNLQSVIDFLKRE